jgi:hypothetical protein
MTIAEVPARRPIITSTQVQAGAPALALRPGDWLSSLLVFVVAALALLFADVAALRLHSGAYVVPIGNYRDKPFLEHANYQEAAPDGTTYRWTTGDSTLRLNGLGVAHRVALSLDLGGRPAPAELRLTLNDQPWTSVTAAAQPRRYTLMLPPDPPAELVIGLRSPTFQAPGDSRELGVKVQGFTLTLVRAGAPLPSQYLAQIAIVLAAQLAAMRLGWRTRSQTLLALGLALGLAALLSGGLLLAFAYLPRLAWSALALAGLTWLLLPLAERLVTPVGSPYGDVGEMRVLWALMLGACAIRLVGVMEPTFAGQDLGLNLGRLFKTIVGQMVVVAGSSEFANGRTIYPPGPYLAGLPGAVVTSDYGSLLQGFLAILDGSTALMVGLLTRRLGGGRDAARFALLLYAGNISAFAALQFGFSAQIFGQWFTAPLALLLIESAAPPRPRTWLLATALLLLGLFSHIGVAILGITWMGLTLLMTLPRDWRSALWGMALMTCGGLLALGLLYVDIAAFTLSHAAGAVAERSTAGLPGATPLLLKGTLLAYSEVGLALLPLGLALLFIPTNDHRPTTTDSENREPRTENRATTDDRRPTTGDRPVTQHVTRNTQLGWGRQVVPLTMLLTTLLFVVVDITLAMQVRYFYFALPLALAAIAIVLGQIGTRGRWARTVAWVLVLALLFQGTAAWFTAAFGDVQISMTPLTH